MGNEVGNRHSTSSSFPQNRLTVQVAAGVILGESATFLSVATHVHAGALLIISMFKSCCRGRAERMTRKDLNYACLSEAIVQGGFLMALVVRLSILPT